jgi:catechol 2,3-dioxygenase-like lactoylglutathione lyase family enzyme
MRFDHVKFAAWDVGRLVRFYREALGCPVLLEPFETADDALITAIGASPGSGWRMAVLGLPGEGGGRLELYSVTGLGSSSWPFLPGQGQISIEVDDVDGVAELILAAGGSELGEIADWRGPSGRVARLVFLRDPEGNLIDVYGAAD